jgi:hypothetical protein
VPSSISRPFSCVKSIIQRISPCPRLLMNFRNKLIFYGEELLDPRSTPKLEDHPLSAGRDRLFNIVAAIVHIWRPSPPSATWGRAMPWWQGTHLTWNQILEFLNKIVVRSFFGEEKSVRVMIETMIRKKSIFNLNQRNVCQ